MRQGVTAILVARESAATLERTIRALEAQSRRVDRTVFVHVSSRDATGELLRAAAPDLLLAVDPDATYGAALAEATAVLAEQFPDERPAGRELVLARPAGGAADEGAADGVEAGTAAGSGAASGSDRSAAELPSTTSGEWLWLLMADNAPEHDALERLLETVERNPSLAVAGPKLVQASDPAVLEEYGQSAEFDGTAVRLHHGELDQGQFEDLSDVLAVAAGGMLVRRDVWERLGGFDPGLPVVDDALDFCQRVWLSGGRVVLAPNARVESAGTDASGSEAFETIFSAGRVTRERRERRARRTAQLHRRLVHATDAGYALGRATLLPASVVGGLWHLVRKRPQDILPDIAAAGAVSFGGTRVAESRQRAERTRTEPHESVEPLLVQPADARKARAAERDRVRAALQDERERYALFGNGGAWVLLVAVIVSAVLLFPLVAAGTLGGGALLPLSGSVVDLWAHTGYGVRDAGAGVFGVADPFALVLAVLGTIAFWHPSTSLVLVWLLAIPVSALGAWLLAARATVRPGLRAFAAFAWMLAPPLLLALVDGRPAAVIAHAALPWLVFAGLRVTRSWSSAGTTALLAALVAACAPALLPALALLWLGHMCVAGRFWYRALLVPVPVLALFAPLALAHANRGHPLGLFTDPGLAAVYSPVRGWEVALGFPETSYGGVAALVGPTGASVGIVVGVLLAPLAILGVIGLFGHAAGVARMGWLIAVLGFATASLAGGLGFAAVGPVPVPLWIGGAQSLMWLGVLCAACAGLAAIGRARGVASAIALIALAAAVAVPATSVLRGDAVVHPDSGRSLPAIVDAQGHAEARVGTLVIAPLADGSLSVHLVRGIGSTLDEQSTLRASATGFTDADLRLAQLAVSLASDPNFPATGEMHALGVTFVLVQPAEADAVPVAHRIAASLTANDAFSPAGDTEFGSLWQVVGGTLAPVDDSVAAPLAVGNADTWQGRTILVLQAAALLLALYLALPTGSRSENASALVAQAERMRGRRRFDLDASDPEAPRRAVAGALELERHDSFAEEDDDDPDAVDDARGVNRG